jgi:hypothetical protein
VLFDLNKKNNLVRETYAAKENKGLVVMACPKEMGQAS